jgi:HNH endonuclease
MSKISQKLINKIRRDAKYRCGYCQLPQDLIPNMLEIEHLLPLAEGGESEEENLWLACRNCNSYKSSKTKAVDPETNHLVKIFNPRTQNWNEHFDFSQEGIEIIGKTACGRATVVALRLNFEQAVTARRNWVIVGWYPPKD